MCEKSYLSRISRARQNPDVMIHCTPPPPCSCGATIISPFHRSPIRARRDRDSEIRGFEEIDGDFLDLLVDEPSER